MFNSRKKEAKKIFQIFNTLLLKMQKHSLHIKESEVIKLYMRAIEMEKTVETLEYLYIQNGEIDKNLIEGEEISYE